MADAVVDTIGLNCPLPILRAKQALIRVPVGGTLEILATDPNSVDDFEWFCRLSGHLLAEFSSENGVYRFVIKRSL